MSSLIAAETRRPAGDGDLVDEGEAEVGGDTFSDHSTDWLQRPDVVLGIAGTGELRHHSPPPEPRFSGWCHTDDCSTGHHGKHCDLLRSQSMLQHRHSQPHKQTCGDIDPKLDAGTGSGAVANTVQLGLIAKDFGAVEAVSWFVITNGDVRESRCC